ncbi:YceD family protein [Jatrophihabitans fulvus]
MPENTTPNAPAPRAASPRSLFVFDLRELGRRPGSLREYRRDVPAPAGLGLDVIGVPEGAPLDLELRLESVTEGVLVTGYVVAPLTGQCARCLDPVSQELEVDVQELFAYADSATDSTTEQDEVFRVGVGGSDDLLDVEPVVRDAVVLALPWTPLCRPDCAGLCPDCGQRLDDLPAGHAHDQIDPRWAALAGHLEQDSTTDSTTDTQE